MGISMKRSTPGGNADAIAVISSGVSATASMLATDNAEPVAAASATRAGLGCLEAAHQHAHRPGRRGRRADRSCERRSLGEPVRGKDEPAQHPRHRPGVIARIPLDDLVQRKAGGRIEAGVVDDVREGNANGVHAFEAGLKPRRHV